MHTLCALGAFAIGSAFWGAVSGHRRPERRAASRPRCMAAGLLLARPFPLRMGEAARGDAGARPGTTSSSPTSPTPRPARWRWRSATASAPRQATRSSTPSSQLRAPRRRDGATFWRVYRDLARPVALCRALHRHLLGRLPAPARPRHAGRPGTGAARARLPAARRGGDDAALHRRALSVALQLVSRTFSSDNYCRDRKRVHPQAEGARQGPAGGGRVGCLARQGQSPDALLRFRGQIVRNPKDELKTGMFHATSSQLGIKPGDL